MADNTKITNINNTNNTIIVDDGSVRVPIKNRQGDEIGVFFFRPTDVGMIDRFNSMVDEFDKITAPLENVNINPDGTVDEKNAAEFAAMKEAEENLYTACDKLFGGNMSERFLEKCTRSHLSTVISTVKTLLKLSARISLSSLRVKQRKLITV